MSQGVSSVSEGSSLCQTRRTTVGQRLEPWLTLREACRLARRSNKRRRRAVGYQKKSPEESEQDRGEASRGGCGF